MKQSQLSWSQTLLYSVGQDNSAQYEAEKIIFHHDNMKLIHNCFSSEQQAIIYGSFGHIDAVENFINSYYPAKPFSFSQGYLEDGKGNIVVVFDDQVIIFCLIMPLLKLTQKPFPEKSIDITLFRILQDMSQTIIACMSDEILNTWYSGENIPFNDSHVTQLAEFKIQEKEQVELQILETKLENQILGSFNDWKIIDDQNSTSFLLFRKIQLTPQELGQFENELTILLIQILLEQFQSFCSAQLQMLINKFLSQIFQTTGVILKIVEYSEKLKPQIEQINKKVYEKMKDLIIVYYLSASEYILLNQCYKHLIDNLWFKEGKFSLMTSLQSIYKLERLKKIEASFLQSLNKLVETFVYQYKEQMKQELQMTQNKQNNYIFQRGIFSTIRQTNQENQVGKVTISIQQSQFLIESAKINQSQQSQNQNEDFELISYYQTNKGNSEIIIVKKCLTYFALLIKNNGDFKKITNFEHIKNHCFLFIPQIETFYGFNHCMNNIIKMQIDETGKILSDNIFYDRQNRHTLIQVIYLSYNQSFIGLTYDYRVVKWSENDDKFSIIKKLVIDRKKGTQTQQEFIPSKQGCYNYNQIMALPNGSLFLLSNFASIDIYDLTYQLIMSFEIKDQIKVFSDFGDAILVNIGKEKIKPQLTQAYIIPNISNRKKIMQMNGSKGQVDKQGNPFFDIMKGSQVKYGPISYFLCSNKARHNYIYIINFKDKEDCIKEYLQIRELSDTCILEFLNQEDCSSKLEREIHKINSIFRIAYSRVPTQFCTIENNQLIPLLNGFRMQINQNESIAITQRAKLLFLGYIEDYLTKLDENVFVISIIGRQSSGKSYLLNRLFGTRFTVAASRCTDGIWASLTQINNKQFLILDCEGLFSRQRTNSEETQLLSLLAGVCDITILNQDLSFNRYLDELLDNLTNVIGKLKGEKLFKGSLLIALRDINSGDNEGAQDQLLQSIIDTKGKNSKNSNFMTTLFNDCFKVQQFQNFQHQNFTKQIDELRKKFFCFSEKNDHWKTGKELIQTIKILLIQLETKDDENTDAITQKMQIDETVEKAKNNWIIYPFELKMIFLETVYFNNQYKLWEETDDQKDFQKFCQNLLQTIFVHLNLKDSIRDHNFNCQILQDFLIQCLQQRKKIILQDFDSELIEISKNSQQVEHVKKQRTELIRYIEEQESQYKLCQMLCNSCFLRCSKMSCHSSLLQQNIHNIDNQLKVLNNKNLKQTTSQTTVSNTIENLFAEQQKRNAEFKVKLQEVQFYENLLILLNLENEKNKLETQLLTDPLSDSKDCTKINFIKIKDILVPFEYYKTCDQDIIILNPQGDDIITKNQDLRDFCMNKKEQLKVLINQLKQDQEELNKIDFEVHRQILEKDKEINQKKQFYQQYLEQLSLNETILQKCEQERQVFQLECQNILKKMEEIVLVLMNPLDQIDIFNKKQESSQNSGQQLEYKEERVKFDEENESISTMHQKVDEQQSIINKLFDQFQQGHYKDYLQIHQIVNEIKPICKEKQKKYESENQFSQIYEEKIIQFIEIELPIYFIDQIVIIRDENQVESILEVENIANEYQQKEIQNKLELLTDIENDQKSIADLYMKFSFQQENLQATVTNKSCQVLLDQYTELLSQRTKLLKHISSLSQIKTKVSGKKKDYSKKVMPKSEIDNANKELQITLLNIGVTYEQALQIILQEENNLQVQSAAFEEEHNDLDQVEEIMTQFQENGSIVNLNQILYEKKLEDYQSTYLEEKLVLQEQINNKKCEILISQIKLEKLKQVLQHLELKIKSLTLSQKLQQIVEKSQKLELEQNDLKQNAEQLQQKIEEQIIGQNKLKNEDAVVVKQRIDANFFQLDQKTQCLNKIEQVISGYQKFQELLSSYRSCCEKINLSQDELNKNKQASDYDSLKKNHDEIQNQIQIRTEELKQLEDNIEKNQKTIKDLQSRNQELTQYQELTKQFENLKQMESQDHSCQRESHSCDQICAACNNQAIKCANKANHQQEHLCAQSEHYCILQCAIKNCNTKCTKQYQHNGDHSCQTFHQCKNQCLYCGMQCQYDFSQKHNDHQCSNGKCTKQCCKCKRVCIQDHKHSKHGDKNHFCENIHACSELCTVPGICYSEYIEEKKIWHTSSSSFEYTYFRQINGGKKQCTLEIKVGQFQHKESHSCKREAHRCGAKCPECDGLCTKSYGHQGFHSAAQHRNKDDQVFTLKKSQGNLVKLLDDHIVVKSYQVGDSCCPENCKDSCARRQNSHFHLLQCEGGQKCLQTQKNKFARHQQENYQGFDEIQFDEVLCVEFWRLNQWEHPIQDGTKLANLERCDFYCPFCPETNKQYCKLSAWHSFSNQYQDHEFQCKESHNNDKIIGMDIVFVIDATGSMGKYINQSKEMIKQIIGKAKLTICKTLRFGIVAYRDHEPQEKDFLIRVQELGSEATALEFLEKLKADGGGDYPEAVLDGLQGAVNLSWLPTHDKMVFLVGDAPPHGKIYSDQSSWPEGCPCKINEKTLFRSMESLGIQFKILELTTGLAKMIQEFKKHLPSLEIIKQNEQFNFVDDVVKKVCKQIEMREITYTKKK